MSCKLKPLEGISSIDTLRTLPNIKPLTTQKIQILNNISGAALLLLSSEILLQCRYALDSGSYDNELMLRRIATANKLTNAADNPNELYFNSDVKQICKGLRIKNPL